MNSPRPAALLLALLLPIAGCAALGLRDPVSVDVVGVEPIQGEGMESRFLLKLRVQNPNEMPIEYDGLFIELEVGGSRIASGVSDERGTIPRFGETVVSLPVSLSMTAVIRRAIDVATGERGSSDYVLHGRLAGPAFGGIRFETRGALAFPFPAGRP